MTQRRRTADRASRSGEEGFQAVEKPVAEVAAIGRKSAAPEASDGMTFVMLSFLLLVSLAFVLWQEMSPGRPKDSSEIQGIATASRIAANAAASLEEPLHRLSFSSDVDGSQGQETFTAKEVDLVVHRFLSAQGATAEPLLYGGFTGSLLRPTDWPMGRSICRAFDVAVGMFRRAILPSLPPLPFCGFPAYSCISVNSEVCHGVPSAQPLRPGDLVKVDIAARKNGFVGDTCVTFIAGGKEVADPDALRIADVARESLFLGILAAGSANRTHGDIGHAVQMHAKAEGFAVNTLFSGHGVGRSFHEAPRIHHTGSPGRGAHIKANQVFTIEPILAEGNGLTTVADDGWTVLTRDGSLSAQWEHTVATTSDSVEILTFRPGESWPPRLASKDERSKLFERAGYDATFSSRLEASAQILLR